MLVTRANLQYWPGSILPQCHLPTRGTRKGPRVESTFGSRRICFQERRGGAGPVRGLLGGKTSPAAIPSRPWVLDLVLTEFQEQLVDQCRVVAAVWVEAPEGEGVGARRHLEPVGRVNAIISAGRGERTHHGVADQHLKRLGAFLVIAALGGAEAEHVAAGEELHHRAEIAVQLKEADRF